jgi:hypothetical protein
MSLKALARQRLAIIRAAETGGETCFIGAPPQEWLVKHGKAQETAENEPCFTVSSPHARNSETSSKQALIEAGLQQLAGMTPPTISKPPMWWEVRADALRLASDGWVTKALALGWEPLHLFGCSGEAGGDPDQEGLAVQLAGRVVLLLNDTSAIISGAPGVYACFNIRPMPQAVFLWDLPSGGLVR